MALPVRQTFDDSLRIHDAAVVNWLQTLLVDYGNIAGVVRDGHPILTVFSPPEHAFATVIELLTSQGWIRGNTNEKMRVEAYKDEPSVPLPIVSIMRSVPQPDPELMGSAKSLRRKWLNPATAKYEIHPFPLHYRTEYTLTFWSRKRYTDTYIQEWVTGQLGKQGMGSGEVLIPVVHKQPWGTSYHSMKMVSSNDSTDLEPGEGERGIRTQYTFSLRTWITRPKLGDVDYLESFSVRGGTLPTADGSFPTTVEIDEEETGYETENLFRFYPRDILESDLTPITGDAECGIVPYYPRIRMQPVEDSVLCLLKSAESEVELCERIPLKNSEGHGVVSIAFNYASTAVSNLKIKQKTVADDVQHIPEIEHTCMDVALNNTSLEWEMKHKFAVVTGDTFSLVNEWVDSVSSSYFNDVQVRNVLVHPIFTSSHNLLSGSWMYRWASLQSGMYLLVIPFSDADVETTTVTVYDDIYAPSTGSVYVLDPATCTGRVELIAPRSSSIKLACDRELLSRPYLVRYRGLNRGNSD